MAATKEHPAHYIGPPWLPAAYPLRSGYSAGTGVTVEWGPPQMGTQGPYNFKNIGDPVPIMLTF